MMVMRNIKLALLLGVGWGIAVAGGSNEKRSRTIQMKGCVTNYGKMLPGVTIVLYEDGLVTKSIETLDNGKFTFELMWDKCYILEFHKVSHVPKRVRVSTILIDNTISDLSYEFDVELIETWKFEGVNTAVFIRPMAKIAYYACQ